MGLSSVKRGFVKTQSLWGLHGLHGLPGLHGRGGVCTVCFRHDHLPPDHHPARPRPATPSQALAMHEPTPDPETVSSPDELLEAIEAEAEQLETP